jgi:hypothetical protein
MTRTWLFPLLTIVLSIPAGAEMVDVTASGMFSASDTPDSFTVPGDTFSLSFLVDANPILTPSQYTAVSFDVPVSGFNYKVNDSSVSVTPSEITFYASGDGGGLAVNFPTAEFIFSGNQIFSGPTSAPSFSPGSFPTTGWTFLDSNNVDFGTGPAVTVTPEPSLWPLLFLGGLSLAAVRIRKGIQVR